MKEKEKIEGLTVKKESLSEWYLQVILKADLIDYSSVSGCIILKPYGFAIWEKIVKYLDNEFKKSGVKNTYFPLFIPERLLKKEAEHIEGFAPEVAWVTHAGNKKLDERLAIRPTSETIMYESYSKWIRSHRDLPLRLNQWNSMVRWEFKHPTPFLRTREVLWQEGHSAFATHKESLSEVKEMLNIYEKTYQKLLAVPVLKGKKTESEKFPGALDTYSVESFLPDGKAIQGATSHDLGQNFSKSFEINFLDKEGKKEHAWQTSWGFSTRSVGILTMLHGDDKGLILPPEIAPYKIVIIPIIFKNKSEKVIEKCIEIKEKLKKYEVMLDDNTEYSAGWKFNEYELKGVPIRIEIGPKDIENKQLTVVRRDTGKKEQIKEKELEKYVEKALKEIQDNLFKKAEALLKGRIKEVSTINELTKEIKKGNLVLVEFCGLSKCENEIKDKSGAKSLNMPSVQKLSKNCVVCNEKSKYKVYFGRSH